MKALISGTCFWWDQKIHTRKVPNLVQWELSWEKVGSQGCCLKSQLCKSCVFKYLFPKVHIGVKGEKYVLYLVSSAPIMSGVPYESYLSAKTPTVYRWNLTLGPEPTRVWLVFCSDNVRFSPLSDTSLGLLKDSFPRKADVLVHDLVWPIE